MYPTAFPPMGGLSAHTRKKKIRGNQAAFMTKKLNKQIMKRSKSKTFKWPFRERFLAYENQKQMQQQDPIC